MFPIKAPACAVATTQIAKIKEQFSDTAEYKLPFRKRWTKKEKQWEKLWNWGIFDSQKVICFVPVINNDGGSWVTIDITRGYDV